MELSKMGIITNQCLIDIPKHFSNVTLDEYVVMPNHIHLLLNLLKPLSNSVETHHDASLFNKNNNQNTPLNQNNNLIPNSNQNIKSNQNNNLNQSEFNSVETHHDASLSIKYNSYFYHRIAIRSSQTIPLVIKQFKSAVTHQINPQTIFFGWQPRFHDQIIQNEKELLTIKNYIINNPINWQKDKYYNLK